MGAIHPQAAVQFGTFTRKERIERHLARTHTPAFQKAYVDTYQNARRTLETHLQQGNKGFVVLDIDETVLDNREYFSSPHYYQKASGFPSIAQTWAEWVNKKQIPVIPVAKRFIDWLNTRQIPYVFLTGIRENLKNSSVENLRQVGLWGRSCLGAFYKPADFPGHTAAFKQVKRPELEQRFRLPILASIGDQPGDMTGDSARDFLLPDYVRALRKENDHG